MCSTNFVMRSKNFFMCSTKFVMCSKNFFMCSKNSGCGEICDYCMRFLILWLFRPVNHRNFCLHAIGKFTMDYTLDSLAWKQKEKWRATREESDRLVSLLLCTACRRQISPNLHAIKRREQQLKEADFLRSTGFCSKGERSEFAYIRIDVVPQNVIVITTNVSFFLKLLPRRCRNIN